jgi:hypothetical protein
MALTTEARELIVTSLTGLGYKIYDTVPTVPVTPSVVIVPDSPWVQPTRLGSNLNYAVRWRLLLSVNVRVNAVAIETTEDALDVILAALPKTVNVASVNAPQLLTLGAQGTVMTTEIQIQIQMKEG